MLTAGSRPEHVFPTLTPAQLARLTVHGRLRRVGQGEVLLEAGDPGTRFFVVTAGQIDIIRLSDGREELVVAFHPGQFTGEVGVLSGRRTLVRVRAAVEGEVIEVDRADLLAFVQTDSELSDIIMRAFILRRVEMIAQGVGDVVLIGSSHCSGTLRIKEFLTRNGHPYTYMDLDSEASVQALLDHFGVKLADVPVAICAGQVLRNPTNREIADCLGFNEAIDQAQAP